MAEAFLRAVEVEDKKLLFDMTNELLTRKNSFSTRALVWEDHVKWFNEKAKNPLFLMYFLMLEGEEVGYVRLELTEKGSGTISYSIVPVFRGRGLGKVILQLLELKIQSDAISCMCLLAEVKKDNVASQVIFRDLGYSEREEKHCYVYMKTLNDKNYNEVQVPNYAGGGYCF